MTMKKNNNNNKVEGSTSGVEKIDRDFEALHNDLKDMAGRMDNVTYRDFVERIIAMVDLQHAKLKEFEKAADVVYTICKGDNL